ncbi:MULTISPECIES: glycosyltransferase family 2 protein [unclassified Arenibacter]|jgi:glycosyltransferase involved in cell wall biosynthesis|uniref:glycosyltransferase family 2 protein n=1 Tax=unclassified Arenibacter TaxID=2615047 RepID=UPI000E34458C|nr:MULTISPECIES: glycosyltransferase family 2 protein [unclassified Arenibacter]MCM4163274.1 glycosyl transferase family 2 [Arenibacter sp. A80]RFT57290.1 glycosyltransferase family 2 protein [Arenibacter sp. P308M17]
MDNRSVSILIPFKNTAEFIPECIQSIIGQTYNEWEILAVNDHATDNSPNILNAYAQRDARIKVFKNDGKGIIEALRTAYSRSKGTYITRMDSDDIMSPKKMELMVNSLKNHGPGHVALGKVKYFSKDGVGDGYKSYEKWLNHLTEKGTNYCEIYKECVIPSPCWMVHREDLEKAGSFSSERYPEDYDLAFRFYEQGLNCIPTHDLLHFWRDYDHRTSRTSEHYAQNYFLDIKLYYFLKLDRDDHCPLVLWGAGKKGKTLAKKLLKKNIAFTWVCNNSNKIGLDIYDKKMYRYPEITKLGKAQIIITVANKEAQVFIKDYLLALGKKTAQDFFFFC